MRACQPSGLCLLAKHGSRLQTTTEVEKMFEYNERIQQAKELRLGKNFDLLDGLARYKRDKL